MNLSHKFIIQLEKIVFKSPLKENSSIFFNLLHNNTVIHQTQSVQLKAELKQYVFQNSYTLISEPKKKDDQNHFSNTLPTKHMLKRSQMLKKNDVYSKTKFSFHQDMGLFTLYYHVTLSQVGSPQIKQIVEEPIISESNKEQKQEEIKEEIGSIRNIKRPSTLNLNKISKVRKLSAQEKKGQKQLSQIFTALKNDQAEIIPLLTVNKEEDQHKTIHKKDIKINLFEKQLTGHKQSKVHGHGHENNTHKDQHSAHHDKGHGHQNHDNHSHTDQHAHGHGHGQSEPYSCKIKTVIVMLIIGFLFLLYDALDDRFSRKVIRLQSHNQHSIQSHHNQEEIQKVKKKKNKKSKKSNKKSEQI